jgi:predicted AAA+ superfamily ATPase
MPFVTRRLAGPLVAARRVFPALLVTGPRQSGKTTFLREHFGDEAQYTTFDDPFERDFAERDPRGFLDRFGEEPVILDEVQYVPGLFQYLKIRIDADRRRSGRFLLTGSQQFGLMAAVTESLAGRIALFELLPFGLLELPAERRGTLAEVLWNGSYPEVALEPSRRDLWVSSYLRTYLERDVRQLHHFQDLRAFEAFVALAAARHGQELNLAAISREAGVSQPTSRAWLGALEAGYLVTLLPPHFENLSKRVVKSPKLYFLDSALAAALTRQPSAEASVAGAMGGSLFEGFVVAEAMKVFTGRGRKSDLAFWRSHDGLEVDLLVRIGDEILPVEIKLTATPTARHVEPLDRFRRLTPRATAGVLVCRVARPTALPGGHLALPWSEFPGWLDERLSPVA